MGRVGHMPNATRIKYKSIGTCSWCPRNKYINPDTGHALPGMQDTGNTGKCREAEHGQVRVPYYKIGEVHGAAKRHVCLHRALQTHYQIEHYRHGGEPQRDVLWNPATSSLRQHKIRYDDNHHATKQERSQYRGELRSHWNCRIDIVMDAIQWI